MATKRDRSGSSGRGSKTSMGAAFAKAGVKSPKLEAMDKLEREHLEFLRARIVKDRSVMTKAEFNNCLGKSTAAAHEEYELANGIRYSKRPTLPASKYEPRKPKVSPDEAGRAFKEAKAKIDIFDIWLLPDGRRIVDIRFSEVAGLEKKYRGFVGIFQAVLAYGIPDKDMTIVEYIPRQKLEAILSKGKVD